MVGLDCCTVYSLSKHVPKLRLAADLTVGCTPSDNTLAEHKHMRAHTGCSAGLGTVRHDGQTHTLGFVCSLSDHAEQHKACRLTEGGRKEEEVDEG